MFCINRFSIWKLVRHWGSERNQFLLPAVLIEQVFITIRDNLAKISYYVFWDTGFLLFGIEPKLPFDVALESKNKRIVKSHINKIKCPVFLVLRVSGEWRFHFFCFWGVFKEFICNNRHVSNLSKRDFTISEDGRHLGQWTQTICALDS